MKDFNFFEIAAGSFVGLALRYGIMAGLAWWLAYVLYKRRWFHRKIIAHFPSSPEVRREMSYSLISTIIFAAMGGITVQLAKMGYTQLYWSIPAYGWGWFWTSVVLTIFLHDAYFYWTHRMMHHRRLFRYFHRVHHLSHNPTPWAAYSFSPLEAFVQAGIFPLAAIAMPLHPIAFALFMGWQITFNILGHVGYEFLPRWLMDSRLGWFLNTPTNHIMHHEKMRGNYTLYFNLWDRLMGTNHHDYEARFREVTSRNPSDAEPASPADASDGEATAV